jgi:ribosomal-protein-alanine N-acetyltransferase
VYTIEEYNDKDREGLLKIFRLNVPGYFAAEEESDFIMFLDNYADNFYLCRSEGELIGCGGHNMKDELGILSWYIVHPGYHNKGVGRRLVEYNMAELKRKGYKRIRVRTSQFTDKFYEKFGFILMHIEKDFWAKGIDLYEMEVDA